MNRKPIIRFFVSSTFTDMEIERNILKNIFNHLQKEYQIKGWQIEHVDLRWGIRNEASINNQTMRICLKELERCQTLSPQPNFIILLGDRYGWIPLPEIITYGEMTSLYELANSEERGLLADYYLEDSNQLPEKCYNLMPKNHRGLHPNLFEEQVEKPLHKLMKRYADTLSPDDPTIGKFIHSATAQEIDNGALSSNSLDAKVLVYFRSLSGIPEEKKSSFCPKDTYEQLRINQLKENLRQKLSSDNICEPGIISYDTYASSSYQEYFSNEIKKRLRLLIEKEIIQYNSDELQYEINEHFDIADETAEKSVYREKQMKPIIDYIKRDEFAAPLWFVSEKGMGKTTLMAQIVCQCRQMPNTVVIPRFCGHTKYSCDSRYLLYFLLKDLKRYWDKNPFTFEPDMHRILFGKQHGLFDWDFMFNPFDYFLATWRHLPSPTRYIIILDGLNELETSRTPWFAEMKWLPNTPLPTNIKVIITSEPSVFFPYNPNHINIVQNWFKPLNKEERIDFLRKYLQINKRTLTVEQWECLVYHADHMLERSENKDLERISAKGLATPLNLSLLGNEMLQLHSYDNPPVNDVLSNFRTITQHTLERLMQEQNHGKEIVELVLSLIATSQLGVTDEEMSILPAFDNDFYRQFCKNSFHSWQKEDSYEKSLPSILWSRLKTDLNFFLTRRNSTAGYYICFKHKEFKDLVKEESLLIRAKQLWITYFTDQWKQGDTHALSELPQLLAERYLNCHKPEYLCAILNLLSDYHFIMLKQKLLPNEILHDFNCVKNLPGISEHKIQAIETLENEVMSLYKCSTDEEFIYRAANLPKTSYLRHSIQNSGHVFNPPLLENALNHISLNNSIICHYDTNQIGKMPVLSEDGRKVISLHENNQVSIITHLVGSISQNFIISNEPIIWHGTDINFQLYAILTASECKVMRLSDKNIIFHYNLSQNANICFEWCSFSSSGKRLVFGGTHIPALIVNVITGEKLQFKEPIGQSMLSADGDYLWMISKRYMVRYNTNDWSTNILSFEKLFNKLGADKDLNGAEKTLKGCSANIACIRVDNFMIIIQFINENKWIITPRYFQESINFIRIDKDEKNIWIFIQDGGSIQYNIENNSFKIFKTYDIEAISLNLKTALSLKRNVLFNYEKQKYQMVQLKNENSGVNTLASDNRGNTFIVSMGKRITEINGSEIICFEKDNGNYKEKLISTQLIAINDYVTSCVFSPNGSCYAYSMQNGKIIIAGWPNNEIRYKEKIYSCTAMQFTSDSQYLVAANSEYIADAPLSFTILTALGSKLYEYKEDGNIINCIGHNILISPCNRYILTGDKFEAQIIDMVDLKSFNLRNIKTGQLKISSLDIFPAWSFSPNGRWAYISSDESLYRIELITGQSCIYPIKGLLQCISPCGRYLFIKDEKMCLWKVPIGEIDTKTNWQLIAQNIFVASTAICGEYIYILNNNNEILFTDYQGKVLQKAYYDDCIRYKVTGNGFAIAKSDGRVQLFSPLPQYKNENAYAFAICRWNLQNAIQEISSIICPVCGAKYLWLNQEKEIKCKICHTTLAIKVL